MAEPLPCSTVIRGRAWEDISQRALRLRATATKLRDDSAVGETGRTRYSTLQKSLDDAVEFWDARSGTPRLEAYVRQEIDDNTIDLIASYTQMKTAALALRDWIFANIPKDATTGAQLLWAVDVAGDTTELTFTIQQAADFRTEATAFIATIG